MRQFISQDLLKSLDTQLVFLYSAGQEKQFCFSVLLNLAKMTNYL